MFPRSSIFDLIEALIAERVIVRSSIELALLDEFLVDERIEIGIQPAVVDLAVVIRLDFVLYFLSRRLVSSGDHVQKIALKSGQIVHVTTTDDTPTVRLFVIVLVSTVSSLC